MCSYCDKNIEPIFSEKLKNMKKCLNFENLRTSEPQKKLLVLIKKKCVVVMWPNTVLWLAETLTPVTGVVPILF